MKCTWHQDNVSKSEVALNGPHHKLSGQALLSSHNEVQNNLETAKATFTGAFTASGPLHISLRALSMGTLAKKIRNILIWASLRLTKSRSFTWSSLYDHSSSNEIEYGLNRSKWTSNSPLGMHNANSTYKIIKSSILR